MECSDEFPLSTVVYNTIMLGSLLVVGEIIAAQFGLWWLPGYLLLLLAAVGGVMATVCARCGYYGRRCALGLGKAVVLLVKKGREEAFFRTPMQFVYVLLLVLWMLAPVVGGIILLVETVSVWRLLQLAAFVGVLLAFAVLHPKLVCGHCRQGACGACPAGRRLWEAKEGAK